MNNLADYLITTKTRQADFAERVGASQGTISRLKNKSGRPSLELAAAIEAATGGAVPVSCWINVSGDAA